MSKRLWVFILFLAGLTDRLLGKQTPTDEDDVGQIDDQGFDRLLEMNDKHFGFYVTGLFDSLNRDSIRKMQTEPKREPDSADVESVVSDIYGDDFSEKMLGSLAGPAYLDDENNEYALGVSHYFSEDSEEERVGLSHILGDYDEVEVGALYDVLMPHQRLKSAIYEYEQALQEYSTHFDLDDSEDFDEVALGDFDFDDSEDFDEVQLSDFEDFSEDFEEIALGDLDLFDSLDGLDLGDIELYDSSDDFNEIALGNFDLYDSSDEFEEVAVGFPMGPDMEGEPGVNEMPFVGPMSQFVESSWSEQNGPSTESMMVHEPEHTVSDFSESGISAGGNEPGKSTPLTVTGQNDQQLPEKGTASDAAAAVPASSAAPVASTAAVGAETTSAAAAGAPPAPGPVDTAVIVKAVTDAVHDAAKIAMTALREEVKKTGDPVVAAGDIAKVEVAKGADPVTAAVEAAKAVVKSPGSPAMSKAKSEGKDEVEAVKNAEDAAETAAKIAVEAGATAEKAADVAAKQGVKAAEKPKDAEEEPKSTNAAATTSSVPASSTESTTTTTTTTTSTTTTSAAPTTTTTTSAAPTTTTTTTTEAVKDTKTMAKEELAKDLKKTADPVKAAGDVAKEVTKKGKDPTKAANEAAKAVIETPGNPALKKAEEGGKSEAEAIKEVEETAEKAAKIAIDAGATPEKAAEAGAKAAVEDVEKPKESSSSTTSSASVQISTTKSAGAPKSLDCECQEDWTFKGQTYHHCDPRKPEAEGEWCYVKGHCEDETLKPHESEIVKGENWIHCKPSDKPGSCDCQDSWSFKDTLYHHCDSRSPEADSPWCYVKDAEDCVTAKVSELKGGQKFRKCVATGAVPSPNPGASTTSLAPMSTTASQNDECSCKDSWQWEGNNYAGCDIRMPGGKRKWCHVKGHEKCATAERSAEFPNDSWIYCDKCDCEESWEYKGTTYTGCDAVHPEGNRKWCYVWGRNECKSAEPSNALIGEAWKYCDPCDCTKEWEFKGEKYKGCDNRMPEHHTHWCYVADPTTCTKYPKATVTPGQRWRECDAQGGGTTPAKPSLTESSQTQSTAAASGPTGSEGPNGPVLLEAKSNYAKAAVQAPAEILSPPAAGGSPSPNMAAPQLAAAALVFHPPQPAQPQAIQHSEHTMSEP